MNCTFKQLHYGLLDVIFFSTTTVFTASLCYVGGVRYNMQYRRMFPAITYTLRSHIKHHIMGPIGMFEQKNEVKIKNKCTHKGNATDSLCGFLHGKSTVPCMWITFFKSHPHATYFLRIEIDLRCFINPQNAHFCCRFLLRITPLSM